MSGDMMAKPTLSSVADKSIDYKEGITAIAFGNQLLIVNHEFIIGKHSGESVGSKLGEIETAQQLNDLIATHTSEDRLASNNGVMRIPNIDSGLKVATDSLVTISSLKNATGEVIDLGTPLEKGVQYQAEAVDGSGVKLKGIVELKETRAGDPEKGFDPIYQPVIKTEHSSPQTSKINIVIGKINLDDERSAWIDREALTAGLSEQGRFLEDFKSVHTVFTVFPGQYAPAANEPTASQFDDLVGETGNEFWAKHALIQQ